ncbi:MAG TPA: hypothetical protein PLI89_11985, partial [Chitinophagales bacterium]|nr:hypothetical protein [Chitinophagales bacterium]
LYLITSVHGLSASVIERLDRRPATRWSCGAFTFINTRPVETTTSEGPLKKNPGQWTGRDQNTGLVQLFYYE